MNLPALPPHILLKLGIECLNDMQIAAFDALQTNPATLLIAPTGSGKTLAFLLPVYMMMTPETPGIQCLILTPSRELALQIEQVWRAMGTGYKVNTCYGGHSVKVELSNLTEPPALLIGTPGRIADHIRRESIDLRTTPMLVLDEYDKSLTMGFEEDMSFIAGELLRCTRRVLVSATRTVRIPPYMEIAQPMLVDYSEPVKSGEEALAVKTVFSDAHDKRGKLFELICFLGAEPTLIFCNQRDTAEQISDYLRHSGIESAYFHGKMEQIDREKTLVNFRNGSVTFLVASDLAARGLDIPSVRNVIHYELPYQEENFIHRNGRTARMNATGTAYILLHPDEERPQYLWKLPEECDVPKGSPIPPLSAWNTIYISGGKKDKVSKMDIVGFFTKIGTLDKDDIGLIEVMDFMAFAAVKKTKTSALLHAINNEKMKGKKYKIQVAW